jgi:hypothetical protein
MSRIALLLTCLLVPGAASACGGVTHDPVAARVPLGPAPFRFFSRSSVWNRPVPAKARLDPNSAAIIGALNAEIAAGKACGCRPKVNIETTKYSVPVYTVGASQPDVPVALPSDAAPALRAAFRAVPLPPDATPAAGTDRFLVLWQPSRNRLWEFWRLNEPGGERSATYGGAMQRVSSNIGVYGPGAWPGATTHWGASSCSMTMVGGLVTLEDLARGKIEHALMISVANPRAGVYSLPARRTDGTSPSPTALPEGAHLRLDPTLRIATLRLPRLTRMLAEAAQRYGIFVCLRGANIGFYAQDPTPTGTNPYVGPTGYFEGQKPEQLMGTFPWSRLQLLKMQLRSGG